jgi:hypothetical protein
LNFRSASTPPVSAARFGVVEAVADEIVLVGVILADEIHHLCPYSVVIFHEMHLSPAYLPGTPNAPFQPSRSA